MAMNMLFLQGRLSSAEKTTFLYASNLYYGKDVAGKKKLSTHKKVCHAIRVK
jgi:hypothetical protein